MPDEFGDRSTGSEVDLNSECFRNRKKNVTADPLLPEIVPPPSRLMRKQRPVYFWIGLALLLGAFVALMLIGFISD